jgi:hypothetical protein
MNEIVFEVALEADAGYCAECLRDELQANVKEAVEVYFDGPKPARIRLHLVPDEIFALG